MSDTSLRPYDSPVDRIRLHVQGSREAILLVEGETDELVLSELLPKRAIFPLGTRSTVVESSCQLHELGLCGFVAVLDSDFEVIPGASGLCDFHLKAYDGRDLEGMVIELGGLERLIQFKGSSAKVSRYGNAEQVVRDLIDRTQPISALRQLNSDRNWGLRFDAVPLYEKIDLRTLELPLDLYCLALVRNSEAAVDLKAIERALNQASPAALEPRGKDVVAFAAVALRQRIGSHQKAACQPDAIEKDLLGYSHHLLRKSSWLAALTVHLGQADKRLAVRKG